MEFQLPLGLPEPDPPVHRNGPNKSQLNFVPEPADPVPEFPPPNHHPRQPVRHPQPGQRQLRPYAEWPTPRPYWPLRRPQRPSALYGETFSHPFLRLSFSLLFSRNYGYHGYASRPW
uniref:(northern house mosquito) hypothetical protein n=1 Tax=Culex pipiens TaxID=7175 RepID=A0A8D8C8L5_CULPI